MTDRPILFRAPMVRALLDGRKTQTRRVVKPQPPAEARDAGVISSGNPAANGVWCWLDSPDLDDASQVGPDFRCPYGLPGDRLWVKEGWGLNDYEFERGPIPKAWPDRMGPHALCYRATEDDPEIRHELHWRSPIHMPRWASRLTLTLTDVRVERLQDISEADALAEGVESVDKPVEAFRGLWQSINGPGSWDANPWVWALSFGVEARW